MGNRSEVAIYNDMITSGIDSETAKKISLARGCKGSAEKYIEHPVSDLYPYLPSELHQHQIFCQTDPSDNGHDGTGKNRPSHEFPDTAQFR